jgi:hypothetical protein
LIRHLLRSPPAGGEYRFAQRAKYRCGKATISLADRLISLSCFTLATSVPTVGKHTRRKLYRKKTIFSPGGLNDIALFAQRYYGSRRNDIRAHAGANGSAWLQCVATVSVTPAGAPILFYRYRGLRPLCGLTPGYCSVAHYRGL